MDCFTQSNCSFDSEGVEYYTLDFDYFDPLYTYLLQVFTQFVIIFSYSRKIAYYTHRREKVLLLKAKILIMILTIASGFLYMIDLSFPLHSILFVVFLTCHKYSFFTQQIHEADFQTLFPDFQEDVWAIRLLFCMFRPFHSLHLHLGFRQLYANSDYGQLNEDSREFYNYSFRSPWRIFMTVLMMATTNNTPDMALKDTDHFRLYLSFYLLVSCFNLVLGSGLILAIINSKYTETLLEEVNSDAMLQKHLHLLEAIKSMEERKFAHYDDFEEFVLSA